MEEELRKVRSDLVLSGVGVMLFGVWAFAKMILYCLFAKDYINDLLELGSAVPGMRRLVILVWLVSAFASMLLHLYIGLCAFREGRSGKLRRRSYRLLAILGLVISIYTLVSDGAAFFRGRLEIMEFLSELLLGLGTVSALGSLLRSASRLRKLAKEREAAAYAD